MPDGEFFEGKFVQQSSSTQGGEYQWQDSKDTNRTNIQSGTVHSSASAVLIGNRGNTLKCSFQFSEPDWGIDGGGIGQCQSSDGRKLDTSF